MAGPLKAAAVTVHALDQLFTLADSTGKDSMISRQVPAPESSKMHRLRLREKGFNLGFGHATNAQSLPEGVYRPFFFEGLLGYSFARLDARHPGALITELIFQPQLNLVLLTNPGIKNHLDAEAGLGIGLQELVPLGKHLFPFIRIAVGPQYFSAKTIEQHPGFLFSDNVAAGFYWFTSSRWALHAEYRARHMSNANLILPNHGINTYNYLLGISRVFN